MLFIKIRLTTNATVSFGYQITDSDGSTAQAVLKVVVTDDHPVANVAFLGSLNESNIVVRWFKRCVDCS